MIQQSLVSRGSCVVEFIHDDEIVIIFRQFFMQGLGVHRLNGNEQIIQTFRFMVAHKQLSKILIFQNTLKSFLALSQDFFSMRHKQKSAWSSCIHSAKTSVIERRDHGLSRPRSCYDKISVKPAHFPLSKQLIEDLLLVGIRMDIENKAAGLSVTHETVSLQGTHETFPFRILIKLKL